MSQYKKLIASLNPNNSLATTRSKSIAFILTGQSSYNHSELTSGQKKLLTIFERFGIETLETNFPYNHKHLHKNAVQPNLLQASVLNTSQFFQSVFDPQYGAILSQHLSPCLKNKDNVFVVTGSLGQQMFIKSLKFLEIKLLESVTVFALGPVSTTSIARHYLIETITIKGMHDNISRVFDRTQTDHLVNCGHMDYYNNEEVKSIISRHLQKKYPTIS